MRMLGFAIPALALCFAAAAPLESSTDGPDGVEGVEVIRHPEPASCGEAALLRASAEVAGSGRDSSGANDRPSLLCRPPGGAVFAWDAQALARLLDGSDQPERAWAGMALRGASARRLYAFTSALHEAVRVRHLAEVAAGSEALPPCRFRLDVVMARVSAEFLASCECPWKGSPAIPPRTRSFRWLDDSQVALYTRALRLSPEVWEQSSLPTRFGGSGEEIREERLGRSHLEDAIPCGVVLAMHAKPHDSADGRRLWFRIKIVDSATDPLASSVGAGGSQTGHGSRLRIAVCDMDWLVVPNGSTFMCVPQPVAGCRDPDSDLIFLVAVATVSGAASGDSDGE